MGDIALRQPWEELHTTISTEEEFEDACNYKGLTCIEVGSGPALSLQYERNEV